jgi:hypothetical protein
MEVTATQLVVHYYGCTDIALASAVFKPCWHEVGGAQIILDFKCPEPVEWHTQYLEYSGALDLSDLHTVLVARKLEFTKAHKLLYVFDRSALSLQCTINSFVTPNNLYNDCLQLYCRVRLHYQLGGMLPQHRRIAGLEDAVAACMDTDALASY